MIIHIHDGKVQLPSFYSLYLAKNIIFVKGKVSLF